MSFMLATPQEDTGQRGAYWCSTKANQAVLTCNVHFQVGSGEPDDEGEHHTTVELTGERMRAALMNGRPEEPIDPDLETKRVTTVPDIAILQPTPTRQTGTGGDRHAEEEAEESPQRKRQRITSAGGRQREHTAEPGTTEGREAVTLTAVEGVEAPASVRER